MVTLINPERNGDIVSTEYFIESNENDRGYIEYDVTKDKVIKCSLCQEDSASFLKIGANKTVKAIQKLVAANKFPERYRYIWY